VSQKQDKPVKKSDKELWALIDEKLSERDYIFLPHAKKRQKDRGINDLDVLDILENKPGRKRQRNKQKDSYIAGHLDWSYCIEGLDLDAENQIRIIISFEVSLLIVTVIRLDN